MTPFVGQVAAFAFNFAPRGWLPCDGRQLAIQQANMLFSVIGTTYGGDGTATFSLPKIASPGPKGPTYYIAVNGQFPQK
jgi:microcystin-dependent protein